MSYQEKTLTSLAKKKHFITLQYKNPQECHILCKIIICNINYITKSMFCHLIGVVYDDRRQLCFNTDIKVLRILLHNMFVSYVGD